MGERATLAFAGPTRADTRRRAPLVKLCLAGLALAACGRERPPVDYNTDPDVVVRDGMAWDIQPISLRPDVRDVYSLGACGGTRRDLTQTRAEIILVVDRSGSMAGVGADGTPKWNALRGALRTALPRVQANVAAGLFLFPQVVPADTQDVVAACVVPGALQVEPAFNNATAVLAALDAATPAGATPTADALLAAARWFDATPDAQGRRYLVLATDGGPNCNPSLPRGTCRCTTSSTGCTDPSNPNGAYNCLDNDRTVQTLRDLAARGIRTFVIGLAGTESFADVLNAMATAGGEARSVSPGYYSASNAAQLAAAFGVVTSSVADCRFRLDEAPPDPDMVDVRLGSQSLRRDPMHANGWDWSEDGTFREIVFYGTTCDTVRATAGATPLVAAFGCPPGTAPQ